MGRPAELDDRPGRVGADTAPLQKPSFAVPKATKKQPNASYRTPLSWLPIPGPKLSVPGSSTWFNSGTWFVKAQFASAISVKLSSPVAHFNVSTSSKLSST